MQYATEEYCSFESLTEILNITNKYKTKREHEFCIHKTWPNLGKKIAFCKFMSFDWNDL